MKYLSNLDLGKNELQNARIQNLASAPENPAEGQVYYNTTDKTLYAYAGGAWKNALSSYTHPSYTAWSSGLYKVTVDDKGHVSAVAVVTQADIVALGIAPTDHGNHVPAVETANARKFLRNDNTWQTLPAASTSATGIVQLNDTVTSTSTALAATAKAVKTAYDKANHSHPYIPTSQKGAAGGVAELDAAGTVPAAQLPSYVDDVLEYSSLSAFPAEGETGKIYVALDNNKTYRWSGTAYVEISASLALGETSSTAYRGDRGKAAYDHSQSAHVTGAKGASESAYRTGQVNITAANVGLGNVPNVATNDQTPTYTAATTIAGLTSGEKLSAALAKIARAIADLISHLADTTKHITSAERTSWNTRAKKYVAAVGDGAAAEILVTHNLGTKDVTVQVHETASPYAQVFCDVQMISNTQIKLLFAAAPASGAYRVVITG